MHPFKNTTINFPNHLTYLCFFIIPFFASTPCFSQVGINTTTPNALLDIQSTNQATPSNTDGILIPKVDEFPLTNPAVSQDGMMVFVTGGGAPAKGFYYWNNPTSTWIAFTATGAEKIDDLLDGKSDSDGTQDGSSVFLGVNSGLNDDSSDNRNAGVGFETLQANTSGTGNIANGYQSLYSNTGGNWNVANGYWSLYSNTNGNNNTANGNESLYSNTDGYNNTANGYQSIYSNTTGFDNTASGIQSLYTNTIGDNNTAYGNRALYLNTEGNDNTANGYRSLYSNTTGNLNTANGNQSLFSNTIGNFNTANGYQTLFSNTEGINNAANGSRSLFSNITGNDNTANGYRSLYTNTDGNYNAANGSFSLFFNTTGSNNIGVGYQALLSNTTGSFNVGIGRDSGASNSTGSNNIFLGYQAGSTEMGSNKLYIESSNANADNALIYGEFDTNILRANAELQIGNPSVTGFSFPTVDGTANQVLQTDGSGAMSWVDGATLGSNDADWFEEGTTTSPNDINDDIFTQGNVAIGKNTADYKLDIEETNATRVINTTVTGSPSGNSYSIYNTINHTGTANSFAMYNEINNPNTGLIIAVSNKILNATNDGPKLGTQNSISSTGNGSVLGTENVLTNNGSGAIIGTNNSFGGTSSGNFFGSYNKANISAANADIYGVYSEVLRTSGTAFSGFFAGKVAIGTEAYTSGAPNYYTLPASRGTATQVMQTDASGNVTWVDSSTVGGEDADFYEEGTTNAPNDINDDIYTFGNVAIGKNTANYNLDISETTDDRTISLFNSATTGTISGIYNEVSGTTTSTQRGVYNLLGGVGNSLKYGIYNNVNGSGSANHYGTYNTLSGAGTGQQYGSYQIISNTGDAVHVGCRNQLSGNGDGQQIGSYNLLFGNGNGEHFGVNSSLSGSGSGNQYGFDSLLSGSGGGNKYGLRSRISSIAGGTHYGVYADAVKAGSFAGYFLGNVSVGTTTANTYILPPSRGTATQIMQTDGSGNLSWVDTASFGVTKIDDLSDGKSDADGSNDGSSIFLGIDAGSADDSSNNRNVGIGFEALKDNTIGTSNIATGYRSLYSNVDGNANTATGAVSLFANTDGFNNTAYGFASLFQNISNEGNTAIGYQSLYSNTSGSHNTVLGENAGFNNILGSNNVFLGSFAGLNELGSNKLYIENSSGDANNALIYGEFDTNILRTNSTFQIGNPSTTGFAFPGTDGTANQVLQTDGNGQLSWTNGSTLLSASNGLSVSGGDVILGGSLTQNTTITQGANNMVFNLNSSGGFIVQDAGVNHFEVRSSGLTYFGDDTYWNDGSTTGTTLARLYDGGSGNDGVFEVYKDALVQHSINSAATTVFNDLGQDFDFRIEGNNNQNLFYVDAGNDRIGIREATPNFNLHLKQNSTTEGGSGGMGFEDSGDSDIWKIYHSGSHFSFAENGTRRAYVEGGTGNYVQPSDVRLKRDFTLQNNYLSKVKNINIYSYLYKSQTNNKRNIGVKAQELQQLFPELISEGEDGYLGMNYAGLGVIAIQAIKEQEEKIETLKTENQQLKVAFGELLERIKKLENKE